MSSTPRPRRRVCPSGIPRDDLVGVGRVVFVGEGWGHSVGMSQYGAYAMGLDGSTAGEILAHYYNGLEASPGGDFVPERVRVGLDWGVPVLRFTADGPFEVSGDFAGPDLVLPAGAWRLSWENGLIQAPHRRLPALRPGSDLAHPVQVAGSPTWIGVAAL